MNRNRFRNNKSHHQPYRNDKRVDANQSADDSNPIVKSFRGYADELNDKHDRYERIVKHSRDITIESKRLIFLLHTVDMRKENAAKILSDAFGRLSHLCSHSFANIANELENCDPYQYGRAYSSGIQEFIEAYTYYDYLCNKDTTNWNELQLKLTYNKPVDGEPEAANVKQQQLVCLVQPIEFMLGLADISGEIMRKCINALGSGDIETCRHTCSFVQHLYSGYLSLGPTRNKEMNRKMHAMYQSVLKVEKVCYNVKVRGSEAAIWSSSDAIEKERDDDDEGFANY